MVSNRIILADNQAIFRAGIARVLTMEPDMQIVAQCMDAERLMQSVPGTRGCVIVVSTSLVREAFDLFAEANEAGSRIVLITENDETAPEELLAQVDGLVSRNVSGPELLDVVRKVGRGQRCVRTAAVAAGPRDTVGTRVRERLTPRELQIVGFIVQGCKNKEIAEQLGTKEQVVKNYLRSIYDKTGVSDRLELALFTIHHRVLAEAAVRAGGTVMRATAAPKLMQMRTA